MSVRTNAADGQPENNFFDNTAGWRRYKQVRPSSVSAVYPHMPILRVARAHARFARAMAVQRGRRNRFG